MKRITQDQVVEAYRRTGWRPIQEAFYGRINGQHCGCGLGVMAGEDLGEDISDYAEALGLDHDYASGFTYGFDGNTLYGAPGTPRMLGWQDGRAAWEAVKREVLDDADVE